MRSTHFRRIPGTSAAASALLAVLLLAGCNYGFRGGGGFPSNVRTMYIAPFDNKTDRLSLDQLLTRELTDKLPRALGIRLAGEDAADAIVRGSIIRYDDAAQNYRQGDQGNVEVLQHQVQVTVSIELIDVRNNLILWDSQGLTGRGVYSPDRQNDQVAQAKAIENLVQQVIDGAQSQW